MQRVSLREREFSERDNKINYDQLNDWPREQRNARILSPEFSPVKQNESRGTG